MGKWRFVVSVDPLKTPNKMNASGIWRIIMNSNSWKQQCGIKVSNETIKEEKCMKETGKEY